MSTHMHIPVESGGIRQLINSRPKLAAGVIGGLVVVALVAMVGAGGSSRGGSQSYFSNDDGKTFFTASSSSIAPFMSGGKEAYLAVVVSCDGGKTKQVGYLARYTPEAKARNEAILKKQPNYRGPLSGEEVRRPGQTKWVTEFDPKSATESTGKNASSMEKEAAQVRAVKCPDGSNALVYMPE